MFLKNGMRPAFAGAGAQNVNNTKKNSAFTFSASSNEAADFGGFGSESDSSYAPQKRAPQPRKKGFFEDFSFDLKNKKLWLLAGAAALLIAIIVTVIIIIAANSSDDILFENNAYMVYVDNENKYHVVANGDVVEQVFEGEVELIASADNSFAYVFDNTDEGYVMYLLKGKKLSKIIDGQPVEEIIATATLAPGIVYKNSSGSNTNYMFYNEKTGDDQIVRESKEPDHFFISGDAETVTYTIKDKDSDDRVFCIYSSRNSEEISSKNYVPVAISNYGDYIYLRRKVKDVSSLLVYSEKDSQIYQIENTENFYAVLDMNIKGDEVIFCTGKGPENFADIFDGDVFEVNSYLYRYKEKDPKKAIIDLGKNFVEVANAEPEVAVHKTFADTYFFSTNYQLDLDAAETATYYLNKRFEKANISTKYSGKFSPDGDYFYYINSDDELTRMDLTEDSRPTKRIHSNVIDFSITEKGNVYSLNSDGEIRFYKTSTDFADKPSYQAAFISFYNYANRLYFSETDNTSIFTCSESADKDIAKLDSVEITAVPYFTNPTQKKCYAIVFDGGKETYTVYYTSSGNRFNYLKDIDNCETIIINGQELDLSEYVVE